MNYFSLVNSKNILKICLFLIICSSLQLTHSDDYYDEEENEDDTELYDKNDENIIIDSSILINDSNTRIHFIENLNEKEINYKNIIKYCKFNLNDLSINLDTIGNHDEYNMNYTNSEFELNAYIGDALLFECNLPAR
jgi:hypothetical protein